MMKILENYCTEFVVKRNLLLKGIFSSLAAVAICCFIVPAMAEVERYKPSGEYVVVFPGSFRLGLVCGERSPGERPGRLTLVPDGENLRVLYVEDENAPRGVLVRITYRYEISKTEVSQSQFKEIMGYNPSEVKNCPECPVESVSWEQTLEYANKLSEKHGLEKCYNNSRLVGLACRGFRLPTEAEWEFAAKSGGKCGGEDNLDEVAWYKKNSNGTTHKVALKRPNGIGLFDLQGNVAEWVYDVEPRGEYEGEVDPVWDAQNGTDSKKTLRVVKGGSFATDNVRTLYYGFRSLYQQGRYSTVGFRVVRTLE